MNIEEERKAFEALCKQKGISTVRTNVAMMFANGKRMGVGEYFEPAYTGFEFWIQAKKHAEEMAKPHCAIEQSFPKSANTWTVINSVGDPVDYFRTAEEARVWATNNGYRVVEE